MHAQSSLRERETRARTRSQHSCGDAGGHSCQTAALLPASPPVAMPTSHSLASLLTTQCHSPHRRPVSRPASARSCYARCVRSSPHALFAACAPHTASTDHSHTAFRACIPCHEAVGSAWA